MKISRRQLLASLASAIPAPAAAPRPNIVILLSDDMGAAQPGFNGGTDVPTPHMDRIAREGAQLTRFYVQPVCSPTRACLMTGRYAWKNGMERRPGGNSAQGMLKDERTIAQALRDAGYATWMCGKWHLGEWQSAHLPRARGFDHHYGHYGAVIDSFTHTREGVLDWHRNGKPVVEKGYSTYLLADEASKLIREHDGSRPFFLYVPFNAVHGPHMAPADVVKRYQHLGRDADQRAQLECLDTGIGRVLEAIDRKGIANNTLVMFTNDNGGPRGAPNGPLRDGKSAYHEGGVLVPAAIRYPGVVRAGSKSDALMHATDLFPTLCRLAGADPKRGLPLDGVDSWDAVVKGTKSARTEIVHSLQVIRQGDLKLIEQGATYYNWPEQPLQLYDVRRDPYEKNNLAASRPNDVARLRARLAYHRKFAREEETPIQIPGGHPVVYGEEENRLFADQVKRDMEQLGVKDPMRRAGKKGGKKKADRKKGAEQ